MAEVDFHKEYLAKKISIERIFEDLKGLDIVYESYIDEDYKEFNKIIDLVENVDGIKQYSLGYQKLLVLERELNKAYGGLRIIRLSNLKINSLINNPIEEKYDEISTTTIQLIDKLAELSVDLFKKTRLFDESYKTIYNVLLYESFINKSSVLDHIVNSKKYELIGENIAVYIQNGLAAISPEDTTNFKLAYAKEGLGYNYLNKDVIKKISMSVLNDKYNEYQQRKQTALSYILKKADEISKEEQKLKDSREDSKKTIRSIRNQLNIIRLKFLALMMIPVLCVASSTVLGALASREKKTVTKTTNYLTNEQIGEEEIQYQFTHVGYQAEIMKYSPWRKTEGGYERDVTKFDYNSDESLDGLDISIEEAYAMAKGITVSFETKEVLDENDSMTEPEIIITETFVNKDDTNINPLMTTLMAMLFICFAGVMDTVIYSANNDYEIFNAIFNQYKKLRNGKEYLQNQLTCSVTHRVYKENHEKIGDKIVVLREEISSSTSKFGDLFENIDPESYQTVNQFTKIKK